MPAVAGAQTAAPSNSLIVDPQQGATPRPLTPVPVSRLPALPQPPSIVSADWRAPEQAPPTIALRPIRTPSGPPTRGLAPPLLPDREGGLPAPTGDPLAIDPATDPILRLAVASADPEAFRAAIRGVVARNPGAREAEARTDEAEANRNEARAGQYPVVDLSFTHFRVLDRAFSNDPQNILERSRPSFRTDAIARAQQPLFDFGTVRSRIAAGDSRIEASVAAQEDASTQIALRGIAAWYQVFGYRALVSLSTAFVESQTLLRGAIRQRVTQGYSAAGDLAQVDSYIAAAEAQLANYRRQVSSAEASYQALTGTPAPADFGRAPAADGGLVTPERVRLDAETIPIVRYAKLTADAARFDVRTAKASALPGVTVGVDAGRYGVLETARDFDIRGTVTLAQRFGGGATQRISASEARARGAEAAYERIRQDAARDATIALADVQALEQSEAAIRANYLASRQSRDVLAERFRVSRGTLFDLLAAEANYFNVAARYVETVTELDISRYALLARRGKLLDALGIEPPRVDR